MPSTDEDDGETHFEAVERGAIANEPYTMVALLLALSGYWGARLAGVFGERFVEPRVFWIGAVGPLIVTAAPTVFHAVRASLLAIENGLTIQSEPRP
jgi:hypothetical protein